MSSLVTIHTDTVRASLTGLVLSSPCGLAAVIPQSPPKTQRQPSLTANHQGCCDVQDSWRSQILPGATGLNRLSLKESLFSAGAWPKHCSQTAAAAGALPGVREVGFEWASGRPCLHRFNLEQSELRRW